MASAPPTVAQQLEQRSAASLYHRVMNVVLAQTSKRMTSTGVDPTVIVERVKRLRDLWEAKLKEVQRNDVREAEAHSAALLFPPPAEEKSSERLSRMAPRSQKAENAPLSLPMLAAGRPSVLSMGYGTPKGASSSAGHPHSSSSSSRPSHGHVRPGGPPQSDGPAGNGNDGDDGGDGDGGVDDDGAGMFGDDDDEEAEDDDDDEEEGEEGEEEDEEEGKQGRGGNNNGDSDNDNDDDDGRNGFGETTAQKKRPPTGDSLNATPAAKRLKQQDHPGQPPRLARAATEDLEDRALGSEDDDDDLHTHKDGDTSARNLAVGLFDAAPQRRRKGGQFSWRAHFLNGIVRIGGHEFPFAELDVVAEFDNSS